MSLSISPESATATKSDQELSFVLSGRNSNGYTAVNVKLYYGASTDPSGDLDAAMLVWSVGSGLANVPGLIIESNTFSNSSSSGSLSFRITPEIAELYSKGSKVLTFFLLWQRTNYDYAQFTINYNPTTNVSAPTSPSVSATLSRGSVTLSWGAGSEGTNNSVTGYDVQRRESSDGSNWGSWATVSDSPVTGTSLDVTPPGTVGSYYQYRVRTRGSAGIDYYSGWVTSTNTLRRKWDAFGAWTDQTLTAGVSSIRAVHLTQLQERIDAIRAFYGMSAYAFTAVTARKTKIATWAALIGELRSAIDGITTNHAAWNTLEAGKPRIAHITQLRDIIDNM